MGMQNSGWRSAGARQVEDLSNIWTFSGGAPISRASLLATASPSAAQAQFGGMNQIISGPVAGPIDSNGGAITVTSTGIISGGPDGVDAVTSLDHEADEPAERSTAPQAPASAAGGVGVSNRQTISALIQQRRDQRRRGRRAAAIKGGAGGAGVSNAGRDHDPDQQRRDQRRRRRQPAGRPAARAARACRTPKARRSRP